MDRIDQLVKDLSRMEPDNLRRHVQLVREDRKKYKPSQSKTRKQSDTALQQALSLLDDIGSDAVKKLVGND